MADVESPATSPNVINREAPAPPSQVAGKRAEGATPPPKHEGVEVGECLPPARLELSKSLQVHLDPPGWVQVPLLLGPAVSVSPRSRYRRAKPQGDPNPPGRVQVHTWSDLSLIHI